MMHVILRVKFKFSQRYFLLILSNIVYSCISGGRVGAGSPPGRHGGDAPGPSPRDGGHPPGHTGRFSATGRAGEQEML